MSNRNYTYKEYNSALSSRIGVHKKYSNFSLHDWIKKNCNIQNNQSILDKLDYPQYFQLYLILNLFP